MSKVAIITDIHFGVRGNSLYFLERQEKFFYEAFFPYLIENNIKLVWILGDIFEDRKLLNVYIMERARQFFKMFENNKIDVICLKGNHDIFYKNTNSISSLDFINSSFKRITVIDDYEIVNVYGKDVAFISWITPEKKVECLNWINTINAPIICGHFEINNFEIIRGVLCSEGLDQSIFSGFQRVFSGHFHTKMDNGKIYYLGNPFQTNWGETDIDKGFHVYDVITNELEFIKNPIDNYVQVSYSDTFMFDSSINDEYRDKIVRVNLSGNYNKNRYELFLDSIGKVAKSIEVKEMVNFKAECETFKIKTDTHFVISEYLDNLKVDTLDIIRLKSIMVDLYKSALEKSKYVGD